jgi:hypothetical protein
MFYPGSRIRIRKFFHPGSYVLSKKGDSKRKLTFFILVTVAGVSFKCSSASDNITKILKKILLKKEAGSGIRDSGSVIRKNFIPDPDPGSRGKKSSDPGSGSATLSLPNMYH